MRSGIVTVIYLVIGLLLAANHHYLSNVNALKPLISLVLAILLWPLLLVGINLHVH